MSIPVPPVEGFDAIYEGTRASPTLHAIYGEVYGCDPDLGANQFSFTSPDELARIASSVLAGRPGAGMRLLDVGCGAGGPALAVARETGADLVGVDWSRVAVERARTQAELLELAERARFEVADATKLPFADGSFDGAFSVDVLQLMPDRAAAIREVGRVLKKEARFVFTSWQGDASRHEARMAVDFAPLLEAAGLRVDEASFSPEWIDRAKTFFALLLERSDRIRAECGPVTDVLCEEATKVLATEDAPPRVLYATTKR